MTGRDPGLQPERTALSWRRTQLAATVAALVVVRVAARHWEVAEGVRWLAAVAAAGVVALVLLVNRPRARTPEGPLTHERTIAATAAMVGLLALLETTVALLAALG